MAITVRLGANTLKIDAPDGKTLGDIIVDVAQEHPIAESTVATMNGQALSPDDLVPDNSRVVLTQPAGEKG